MTHFEQFIQHRALCFKFNSMGTLTISDIERMVENGSIRNEDGSIATLGDVVPMKLQNVCAKLDQSLVDRLDNALGVLEMTKREFIELALIEALNKVDAILDETHAFEFIDARSAAGEPEGM